MGLTIKWIEGPTFRINRTQRAPYRFWPPYAPLNLIGDIWSAVLSCQYDASHACCA